MPRVKLYVLIGFSLSLAMFPVSAAQLEIALVSEPATAAVTSGRLSPNGRFVTWEGYLYDRSGRVHVLIGHQAGNPAVPANGSIFPLVPTVDGRFVPYVTGATDVATGVTDTNAALDAYLYDRETGTATLLSHPPAQPTTAADAESTAVWMSNDANRFLLSSRSLQLLDGMTGAAGQANLFFRDEATGTTRLVSHSHSSQTEGGDLDSSLVGSIGIDLSGVLYLSPAFNLVPNFVDHNDTLTGPLNQGAKEEPRGTVNHNSDLYFYSHSTRQSVLITHKAGLPSEGSAGIVSNAILWVDGSGAYFTSTADDLFEGQVAAPGQSKIFRWHRPPNGVTGFGFQFTPCAGSSWLADTSANSNLVLFSSTCALVAGDTPNRDVYLYSSVTSQNQLISHVPGNPTQSLGLEATAIDISDDGRRVIYSITDAPGNPGPRPYSYDRQTGIATPLSPNYLDPGTTVPAEVQAVSADGNHVLLASTSTSLAPGDNDSLADLYLVVLSELFANGFENGSTAAWSATFP